MSELVREDQEVDRIIAAKVQETAVPADLKSRISQGRPSIHIRPKWIRRALLAAACLLGLAVLFGSWRGPFAPAVTFGESADEMASFVRLDPFLAFKSTEDASIERFLSEADAPSHLDLARIYRNFRQSDVGS